MATVTMGSTDTNYVSKKAFYWTVGILVLLVAALLFSLAPNRNDTMDSTSRRGTGAQIQDSTRSPGPVSNPPGTSTNNDSTSPNSSGTGSQQ